MLAWACDHHEGLPAFRADSWDSAWYFRGHRTAQSRDGIWILVVRYGRSCSKKSGLFTKFSGGAGGIFALDIVTTILAFSTHPCGSLPLTIRQFLGSSKWIRTFVLCASKRIGNANIFAPAIGNIVVDVVNNI